MKFTEDRLRTLHTALQQINKLQLGSDLHLPERFGLENSDGEIVAIIFSTGNSYALELVAVEDIQKHSEDVREIEEIKDNK